MTEQKLEPLEMYLTPDARTFMERLDGPRPGGMPIVEDIYSVGVQRRWFVVYTHPQAEGKAVRSLKDLGIDSYAPVTKDWRRQSRKDVHQKKARVEVISRLLKRYVFVHLPVRETSMGEQIPFGAVRDASGVQEIVGTQMTPISVADSVVEEIRSRELAGVFDYTIKRKTGRGTSPKKTSKQANVPKWVDVGVTARVIDGPFASFCGLIEEILSDERVKMSMNLFGRTSTVEIFLDQLEKR